MAEQTKVIIIYVVVILIGRIISLRQRKRKYLPSAKFKNVTKDYTAFLVAASAAVSISLPVLEASLNDQGDVSIFIRITGILIIVTGWVTAYFANQVISESWSPIIDKNNEQDLKISGVYSIIRHPLYLSGILIIIGTNIYFMSSWAWLGAIAGIVAISIRIPIEEKKLIERFGQEYVDYQQRTKVILPLIL